MKKGLFFLIILSLLLSFTGCNVMSGVPGGVVVRYEEAESYTMGGVETDQTVETLSISWVSGSIDIRHHDGDTIIVEEKGNRMLNENTSLYHRLENGTLTLYFAKSDAWIEDGLRKDLTILLPRRLDAVTAAPLPYDLDIENVSSDVTVTLDRLGEFAVENVSGVVEAVIGKDIEELDLETVSGDVTLQARAIHKCDMETVSGNVVLTATSRILTTDGEAVASVGELDAESVSGAISLNLHEESDFEVHFESVSGAFTTNFEYTRRPEHHGTVYTVGNGNSQYDVETVSGVFRVRVYKADAS